MKKAVLIALASALLFAAAASLLSQEQVSFKLLGGPGRGPGR
ncbi:MAG: hypothetical protein ABSG73_10860 [Candidatus Aminicenantales bacterium]|jgi:hypothetical protein